VMSVSVVVRLTSARRSRTGAASAPRPSGCPWRLLMTSSSLCAEAGGPRVRAQALLVGDRRHRGRERGGGRAVEFYHSHTLAESIRRETLPETRGAAGGQHVVGAGGVVGEGGGRVRADEHGPGVAYAGEQVPRIRAVQLEVLRRER